MLAMCVLWGCSDDGGSTVKVSSETLVFPYMGDTLTVTVSSDGQWGISHLPDWLSASVASGSGNSEVTLIAAANPNKEDRVANIVVYTTDGNCELFISIQQYGMHTCPITLGNTSEKVFGGRALAFKNVATSALFADTVTVKCDTDWLIEGPSWITAVYDMKEMDMTGGTYYTGSGVVCLTANETYRGENARRDTVFLKTYSGESIAKIPVCQLGMFEVYSFNPLALKDGFTCKLKVGSKVDFIYYNIFKSNSKTLQSLTYDDLTTAYYVKANVDSTYIPHPLHEENFETDMDYNAFFIGKDGSGDYAPLSKVCQCQFHSPTEAELRPRVDIKNVYYENWFWHWTVKPNEYTGFYQTNLYTKSFFGNLSPSAIGLWYAYQVYYVGLYTDMGDDEKNFSKFGFGIDQVFVVAPFAGRIRKPATVEVYITDSSN